MSVVSSWSVSEILNSIEDGYAGSDQRYGMWTQEQIKKPHPANACDLYIGILEFLGVSTNISLPGSFITQIEYPEMFTDEPLFKAAVVRNLRYIFHSHGVKLPDKVGGDFNFSDISNPKPRRFQLILSQLLNIAMFHEVCRCHTKAVNDQFQQNQKDNKSTEDAIKQLKAALSEKSDRKIEVEEAIRTHEINIKSEVGKKGKMISQYHEMNAAKQELDKSNKALTVERDTLNEELEMTKNEHDRLEELVVTDPDEWGRTFDRISQEIENTKIDIQDLRTNIPLKKNLEKSLTKVLSMMSSIVDEMKEYIDSHKQLEHHREEFESLQKQKQTEGSEIQKLETERTILTQDVKLMTENHDVNMKRMNRDIQKIQSDMERVTDIVYEIQNRISKKTMESDTLKYKLEEVEEKKFGLKACHDAYIHELEKMITDHLDDKFPKLYNALGKQIGKKAVTLDLI